MTRPEYYRFLLGGYECVALCDGYHDYKLQNMVTNASRPEAEAALQLLGLPPEFVTTPYTSLFVNTGKHRYWWTSAGAKF
jgi:hypothetical protein